MSIKIIFTALIIFTAAALAFAQENPKGAEMSKDEANIRQAVQQLENGWNTRDGKAFAAPFTADADYVVVNGMYIKGREAINKGHQQIFDTVYKDSTNKATVKGVRFVRADVAIVHVEWELAVRYEGKEEKGKALNTLIMTKDGNKWSIAAFHNTRIKEQK